jgi:hypothetical protein
MDAHTLALQSLLAHRQFMLPQSALREHAVPTSPRQLPATQDISPEQPSVFTSCTAPEQFPAASAKAHGAHRVILQRDSEQVASPQLQKVDAHSLPSAH